MNKRTKWHKFLLFLSLPPLSLSPSPLNPFKPIIQQDAYNWHFLTSEGPYQITAAALCRSGAATAAVHNRCSSILGKGWRRSRDQCPWDWRWWSNIWLGLLTSKVRLDDLVYPVTGVVANELAESIDPVAKCNHDWWCSWCLWGCVAC